MKIEIEKIINSYFESDTIYCKIKRSKDGSGLWSISIHTKYIDIPQYINVPKKLLMNPRNYPLIANDLKLLLDDFVHPKSNSD